MIIKRKSITIVGAIAMVCVFGLLFGEALACFSPGQTFQADPDADKIVIPKPALEVGEITRGGKKPGVTGTCDTYGKITINVKPALANVGYEFEIVEDEKAKNPPDGFKVPQQAQYPPAGESTFLLFWEDGLETPQEPFKFKLRVKTYAPNGEPGPVSEPVLIEHGGS